MDTTIEHLQPQAFLEARGPVFLFATIGGVAHSGRVMPADGPLGLVPATRARRVLPDVTFGHA